MWNMLSQSEVMDYRIQKSTHIRSKKSIVVTFLAILFLKATIMALLENLLMTMKTWPLPCLIEGRLEM